MSTRNLYSLGLDEHDRLNNELGGGIPPPPPPPPPLRGAALGDAGVD